MTGTLCEVILDPCQSTPCYNNGACSKTSNGGWACNCTNNCFTGQRCQTVASTCTASTCSGNGYCLNTAPCLTKCICNPGKLKKKEEKKQKLKKKL